MSSNSIEQSSFSGKITAITGCMFASKSTTLISYYQKYKFANKRCIIIKHRADTRYQDMEVTFKKSEQKGVEVGLPPTGYIISHDQIKIKADYETHDKLSDIESDEKCLHDLKTCSAIIIEEGHFYSDCADFAEKYADIGKHVIVAGLMCGEKREPIPTMIRLIVKAEEVIKLNALCSYCYEPASFTKLRPGFTIGVGGAERYTVRCRKCYNKE